MAEERNKHRKYWLLALFGLFVAIIAYALADEALNQEIAFEIVKNNTDLCNFNHTSMLCNGIRQNNVTYYTNNTPIVLYVFAHASAAGGVAGVFVYRDNILIQAQSGRPLAAPEQTWRGITAIIPRNSSYKVNFTDFHHFEWYEDQILSGRNGTLSYNTYINQTGGGCTGDCNFSALNVNSLGKNNTLDTYTDFIHLKSPFKDVINNTESFIDLRNSNTFIGVTNNSNGNTSDIIFSPDYAAMSVSNGFLNSIEITLDKISFLSNSISMTFNGTYFDMGGAKLINCSNCGSASDNTKVNKTGDTMTGTLNFSLDKNQALDVNITALIGYPNDDKIINITHNNKIRTYLRSIGIQAWQLNNTLSELGWIEYTTPGSASPYSSSSGIGILFRPTTGSNNNISRIVNYPEGILIQAFNQTGATAYTIFMNRTNGNVTISKLAGTGNAYTCSAPDGTQYRGSPGC